MPFLCPVCRDISILDACIEPLTSSLYPGVLVPIPTLHVALVKISIAGVAVIVIPDSVVISEPVHPDAHHVVLECHAITSETITFGYCQTSPVFPSMIRLDVASRPSRIELNGVRPLVVTDELYHVPSV